MHPTTVAANQIGHKMLEHRDLKQKIATHSEKVSRIISSIHNLSTALPDSSPQTIGLLSPRIQHYAKLVDWEAFTKLIDELAKLQKHKDRLEKDLKTEWDIDVEK